MCSARSACSYRLWFQRALTLERLFSSRFLAGRRERRRREPYSFPRTLLVEWACGARRSAGRSFSRTCGMRAGCKASPGAHVPRHLPLDRARAAHSHVQRSCDNITKLRVDDWLSRPTFPLKTNQTKENDHDLYVEMTKRCSASGWAAASLTASQPPQSYTNKSTWEAKRAVTGSQGYADMMNSQKVMAPKRSIRPANFTTYVSSPPLSWLVHQKEVDIITQNQRAILHTSTCVCANTGHAIFLISVMHVSNADGRGNARET